MAVTHQSIQLGAFTVTDLTITKPVSLAVGDLMIAFISQQNTSGITSPAGWTRLASQATSGSSGFTFIDYIVATSTEVAATNFTWLNSGGNPVRGGIVRITGQHPTNPVAVFAKDGAPTATATPSFAISVTPNNPSSLLYYSLVSTRNATRTASGYAVTTDNPSWTELYDSDYDNGGNHIQASLAYAQRTQVTATGNATVTMSGASDEFAAIMVVVRPLLLNSVSDTVTMTDSKIKLLMKVVRDTFTLVETLVKNKYLQWNNQDKNSSTWSNQDKS